jgi:DUF4097 and DUF4098 domain-containing protein YvlB
MRKLNLDAGKMMNTRPRLLIAGITSLALLGIAGARIQARLSAHASPDAAQAKERAEAPSTRYASFGEEVFARQFDVRDGRLEVDLSDADVVLETTSGSTMDVRAYVDASDSEWASEVFEDMDFRATKRGNTVYVEADDHNFNNGEWRDHQRYSVTVVVAIPEGTDVSVQTSDGDIQAGTLSGNTTLRSSDGDIVVDAAEDGDLDIHTSDGDIVVDRLESRRAEIRTSDGDVVLRSVRAPLDVATGDGDIRINLLDANETSVSTGDGDILLTAPADLAADVHMDGEDLSVEQGLELLGRIREHSVQGTLNGGGPTIDMSTGDGSISLRRGN